jgi:hypothetical protein
MKIIWKIALGCIALPFVLMLVFGLLFLVFRAMPLPESAVTEASQEPEGSVTLEQLAAEGLQVGAPVPGAQAVPVSLWLEEGNFTVKAAPEGTGFHVEGKYDKAMYLLTQNLERDRSGAVSFSLSFKPRYSMLRRILSMGSFHIDSDTNALTIYVPRGVPMNLKVLASKGQTRLDLSGLSLAGAALDLSMGEHNVSVTEANPIEMGEMKVNAGMGETDLTGLSNLRAGSITIWGKMGELSIDMGPALHRDTKLFARMKMGEMTIGLPPEAKVDAKSSVFLGETKGSPNRPEGARHLQLDASASMGELRYHDSHASAEPL